VIINTPPGKELQTTALLIAALFLLGSFSSLLVRGAEAICP